MRTLALLGVLLTPFCVHADDRVFKTATRFEIPLEQVAGSVTLIERSQIERRGWRTLADALHEVPGLHVVQSGTTGAATSFFMRGTNSNHTLILMDGFEISDPSFGNLYDGAHFLTENVERIEVLRGPQSTLYGSEALGGVINIITRAGDGGRPRASFWGEVGAYGTVQQATALRGDEFSLSFSNLHTRGFTSFAEELGGHERDGYDNATLSGRLRLAPGDRLRLDLTGRFIDTELETDRVLDDERSWSTTRQLLLGAELGVSAIPDLWEQRLRLSYVDHDTKNRGKPSSVSSSDAISTGDGRRSKLEWLHDLFLLAGHTTTLGLSAENETIDARSETTSAFSTFRSRSHARARTQALFLQDRFALGDRLFGTLGARLDHHDEFGSEVTYRVTAAYLVEETGTKLRGSVGTAFKAPTLTDLYGESVFSAGGFDSTFVGNPELEAEKSFGFELGVDQTLLGGAVRAGTTYYQNRIRNLIAATADFSTLENISRAKTDGLESYISYAAAPWLQLRVDHTYTSAENRESGEDLLRRPTHKLTTSLEISPTTAATVSVGVTYTGHRKDIDAQTFQRISLPGYTVVRLSATYTFSDHFRLFGRIENLFDREYADPHGFQSRPFGGFIGISASF